ncbi:MAG: 2-dehydropantoate 2-reductase [Candidatus Eremiobacteraeota bacterium]|nr:2-dehydropantoate 2-reductase [Candidatus Eremiobacteraeota bacterium]
MRIAVVGAGAIGGFIAGMLARAGTPVAVVARGAHLRAIQAHGLDVRSEAGDFKVALPASDDLRKLGDFEAVLLSVKAHQLEGLLPQLAPSLERGAYFVPMINGIPFWYFADRPLKSIDPEGRLRAFFPQDRLIGCVVQASGNVVPPGTVRQSGGMTYTLGEPDGRRTERVAELAGILTHAGMQAPVETDIRRAVWYKLLGNASLNPVSALTRSTIRGMLDDPAVYGVIATVMGEAMSVACAAGIDLGVTVDARIAHASRLEDVKTSMLQDAETGRRLEIEPIVGALVELAETFGVEVPTLRLLYVLTKRLDAALAAEQ